MKMTSKRHFQQIQTSSSQPREEQPPVKRECSADTWNDRTEGQRLGCELSEAVKMEIKKEVCDEREDSGSVGDEEAWSYKPDVDNNQICQIKMGITMKGEEESDEVEEVPLCDFNTREEDDEEEVGVDVDPLMPVREEQNYAPRSVSDGEESTAETKCDEEDSGSVGDEETWCYKPDDDNNQISCKINMGIMLKGEEDSDEVEEAPLCDFNRREDEDEEQDGADVDPLMPVTEEQNHPRSVSDGEESTEETKCLIFDTSKYSLKNSFAPTSDPFPEMSLFQTEEKFEIRAINRMDSFPPQIHIPESHKEIDSEAHTPNRMESFPPQIHIPESYADINNSKVCPPDAVPRQLSIPENTPENPRLGVSLPPKISTSEAPAPGRTIMEFETSVPSLSALQSNKLDFSKVALAISSKPSTSIPVNSNNPSVQQHSTRLDTASNTNATDIMPLQGSVPLTEYHPCCSINTLLERKFTGNGWTDKQRVQIVKDGQPTPIFEYLNFEGNPYKCIHWLSGCSKLKKYVCWPCLLFSDKGVWSIGYNNKDFAEEATKHTFSIMHKENDTRLTNWKKIRCETEKKGDGSLILRLVRKAFLLWDDIDRANVLKGGKPIPNYAALNESDCRPLQDYLCFESIPWLTACDMLNSTYCWPCLLFSPTCANLRIPLHKDSETTNLKPLDTGTKEHEKLKLHMKACLRLRVRQRELQETTNSSEDIEPNKEEVLKNRTFLKSFIAAICARKKQLSNSNSTKEEYIEIMKTIARYSNLSKAFLEEKYKGLNTKILKSIISSIGEMIMVEMKKEVKAANYISCIIDSTCSPKKNLFSVIIRFVDSKGEVQERFVKLIKQNHNTIGQVPMMLFEIIQSVLIEELDAKDKVVGFTYDGAFLDPYSITMFNQQMQEKYPLSKFFHYTAHSWDVLIQQTLSQLEFCKDFFRDMGELAKFLSATKKLIQKLISINPKTGLWDLSTKFVVTLRNHYGSILKLMETITAAPEEWSLKTVCLAYHFLEFLRPLHTRFMVVLVAEIHKAVEPLSTEVQYEWAKAVNGGAQKCVLRLNELSAKFEALHETAWHRSLGKRCYSRTTNKDSTEEPSIVPNNVLKNQFDRIINDTSALITSRGCSMEKDYFRANKLLSQRPSSTERDVRRDFMNLSTMKLPLNLDYERLATELDFVHSDPIFSGSVSCIKVLHEYDMKDVTSELFKFLEFISTIPMKVTEGNDNNTAIKKMKLYARHNQGTNFQDVLMWMERDLLTTLQENGHFYESVIDHLANGGHTEGILSKLK